MLGWLAAAVLLPIAATIAIYAFNPLRTATADPRARLLGYMVVRFPSQSMWPTITPGDILLVDTTAYWKHDPAAGDVLVYRNPAPPNDNNLHRIVAVPGDEVKVRNGNVWVNGKAIVDDLVVGEWSTRPSTEELVVPADHYFVVGDNARRSADSRVWGTVPRSHVIGRATRVVSGANPGPLSPRPAPAGSSPAAEG